MAKSKNDAGGASGKKGPKIPKQIAGVKIPKSMRESGKIAIKLAQNPAARQMLSAGLVAAAAAVAANARVREAAGKSGREAADTMSDAAGTAADSAGKIGAALIVAATTAAERFFGIEPQAGGSSGAGGGAGETADNSSLNEEAQGASEASQPSSTIDPSVAKDLAPTAEIDVAHPGSTNGSARRTKRSANPPM